MNLDTLRESNAETTEKIQKLDELVNSFTFARTAANSLDLTAGDYEIILRQQGQMARTVFIMAGEEFHEALRIKMNNARRDWYDLAKKMDITDIFPPDAEVTVVLES